jgi:hypothetical protein
MLIPAQWALGIAASCCCWLCAIPLPPHPPPRPLLARIDACCCCVPSCCVSCRLRLPRLLTPSPLQSLRSPCSPQLMTRLSRCVTDLAFLVSQSTKLQHRTDSRILHSTLPATQRPGYVHSLSVAAPAIHTCNSLTHPHPHPHPLPHLTAGGLHTCITP